MLHHRVSAVPVVDLVPREFVGILSETDLLGVQALRQTVPRVRDARRKVRVASDVMTRAVIVTGPETSVDDLIRLMVDHHVKRVPVVADGRLVGMISRTDVIRVLTRPDDDIEREVSEALRDDGLLDPPDRVRSAAGRRGSLGHLRSRASSPPPTPRIRDPGEVIAVDITRDEPERPAELRTHAVHPEARAG